MILFLGGDLRQKYAADHLKGNKINLEILQGFSLSKEIIDKIRSSSAIILPFPLTKDGININGEKISIYDITNIITEDCLVIAGSITANIRKNFEDAHLKYIDIMDIEELQIQNALLTAEGAIYYAKQSFERTIHGARIAILGFGRIGKILAYLLHSQGAKITVCARKDTDYVWSRLIGFDGLKIKKTGIKGIGNKFDIIFNTIPNRIMDAGFAKGVGRGTVIIDLASYPFGIDEELVKKYDLNYRRELSIPGRYAPKSAGEIMGKTIMDILLNRGIGI